MKKAKLFHTVISLIFLLAVSVTEPAYAASELIPVGKTAGIVVETDGVIVLNVTEVTTSEGNKVSPAREAGIVPGDIIMKIGSKEIDMASKLREAISDSEGKVLSVTLSRGGKERQTVVTPVLTEDGEYAVGVWLRDSAAGLGTVTFYDPETGACGALGHGINDIDTSILMPVKSGYFLRAEVTGVQEGRAGAPGQLQGAFSADEKIGTVLKNTADGLFGTVDDEEYVNGMTSMPVAEKSEIELGEASILSNVTGDEISEYFIEIRRIYDGDESGRDMLISVTDERLIKTTGGIVQGMSGSPIIQNGKLIGAVTHVLVNDPTRGYGISIERMLDAAA